MTKFDYTLTTLSDTLLGGGDEVPGVIDEDYETDGNGFPIAGGKRVKGLFVESCSDLLGRVGANGKKLHPIARDLFGESGSQNARIVHFTTAELPEGLRGSILAAKYSPDEVRSAFGVLRGMTSIDDDLGIYEDGSLRTFRLLRSGVVLHGKILISGLSLTDVHMQLLTFCALGIDEAGIRRKRGMGNIKIDITDSTGQPLTADAAQLFGRSAA